MTIRSPGDVNYNTPRINSNSLREGGVELELGANVNVHENYPPTVRSAGDIVNHLEGDVIMSANVAQGDVVATLPVTHAPRHSAYYNITLRSGPTDAEGITVFIDASDNTIKAGALFANTDIISLDGITYLGS